MAWWLALSAVAGFIWAGISGVATFSFEIIKEVLTWGREITKIIFNLFPPFVSFLVFLLVIQTLIGGVFGVFLATNYACDSNDILRQPTTFMGGLTGLLYKYYDDETGNTTGKYDDWLQNHTYIVAQSDEDDAQSITRIECAGQNPMFTVYGLQIFDFELWLAITLIFIVITVKKYA